MNPISSQSEAATAPPTPTPQRDPAPAWCAGDPDGHCDPRETVHRSATQSISGFYGKELLAFSLVQWDNDAPELEFAGDGTWPALNLQQADELIRDLAGHLAHLCVTHDQLAAALAARASASTMQAADGDVTPAPDTPTEAIRTWTYQAQDRGRIINERTETCPSFCDGNHVNDTTTPTYPDDIMHRFDVDGFDVPLEVGPQKFEDRLALSAMISTRPYCDIPNERVPHAAVELLQDDWSASMDPDEFAVFIERMAAQAVKFRALHARLVHARAEWREAQQ